MGRELAAGEREAGNTSVRQAKLSATYAHLYPPVTPEVWMPAAEIGAMMLFWRITREGADTGLGDRLLIEEHFEFRGGWTRGTTSDLRTRVSDASLSRPH